MNIIPPPDVTKLLFVTCGTLICGGFTLALALTPFGIA
jgi:hypothetical protein